MAVTPLPHLPQDHLAHKTMTTTPLPQPLFGPRPGLMRLSMMVRKLFRRLVNPALPTLAFRGVESNCVVKVSKCLSADRAPMTLVHVTGELNCHTYVLLIKTAVDLYVRGQRTFLLDLSAVTRIELTGFFALHNIARLYSGAPLLDPESGWRELRQAADDCKLLMGHQVKLIALPPVAAMIKKNSLCRCFTVYPDRDAALAAG